MSTLTSKQISQTYKQLLKVNVSADTNTGVTGDLQQVQTGDGTNSALQISTSVIQVAGKFGVSEDASVSGDLLVGSKVCASAFFGDGSNLTNVPTSGDVSVSTLRVTHNASIGGTLSVVGAVGLNSTLTVADYSHFKDDVFKLFDTYKFNLNELPRHERIRVHNILNELYYGLLKTKNDKRLYRKT